VPSQTRSGAVGRARLRTQASLARIERLSVVAAADRIRRAVSAGPSPSLRITSCPEAMNDGGERGIRIFRAAVEVLFPRRWHASSVMHTPPPRAVFEAPEVVAANSIPRPAGGGLSR